MLFTALKVTIAPFVIAFASWLAGKRPDMAGFITALPLVSILAIAFAYAQNHDIAITSQYARSIILAVPVSWFFFLQFFTEKFDLVFWASGVLGLVLLVFGHYLHLKKGIALRTEQITLSGSLYCTICNIYS